MEGRVAPVHSSIKRMLNTFVKVFNTFVMGFNHIDALLTVSSTFHDLLVFFLDLNPYFLLDFLSLFNSLLFTGWHLLFIHIFIPAGQSFNHMNAILDFPVYQSFNT